MSALNQLLFACSFIISAGAVNAAPPPNDNFANRIVLHGSSLTFTGTLAGATLEGYSEAHGGPVLSYYPSQSIWWEWTPTASGVVTLQIIDSPSRPWVTGFGPVIDGLAVYTNPPAGFPTNINGNGPAFAGVPFDIANPWPCFSFYATNGTTYYILLNGVSGAAYPIKLLLTNNPIIIEQPKGFSVNTNDSVLFTVMATGIAPLAYQWRFGDALLPGQTNVVLAMDGVTTTKAGDYFVVVSNATGVTTSQVATLTVTDRGIKPSLAANTLPWSNRFNFSLFGEGGRYYRIEISTDLKFWSAESSFPMHLFSPTHTNLTSVIFNPDTATMLSGSADSERQFVRASSYASVDPVCNNNLKALRYAKLKWAWENRKTSTDTPTTFELFTGTPSWRALHYCPEGGVYRANAVDTPPTCSITNHVLEEPR